MKRNFACSKIEKEFLDKLHIPIMEGEIVALT